MVFTLAVNPYLTLSFIGMCLIFLYRYMKELYSTLERLGVPGPKPVWVFGNVLEFKGKNVLDVFDDWKKKFGKVYGFYEGFRPGIVVNDVDFARDILCRNFEKFHIRTSYRPFTYYPDNLRLIDIQGEHWKYQRAILNKMLNSKGTLKRVAAKMQTTSDKMIQQISEELNESVEGMDISRFINSYVTEGVMRMLLDMDEDQMTKHKKSIHNYEICSNWSASAENEAGGLARLFPSLTPLLQLTDKAHRASHEEVVDILREYLKSTLDGQNNNKLNDDDHESLLSYLISSKVHFRDIDGSLGRRDLTTDESIAHILSLFSEIYSTTTAIIQFVLYELARNQDCQEKLYDEIHHFCGKDGNIPMTSFKDMEYFDMIFNETYRHHPIAPGVSRVCAESCKIQGVSFQEGMVVRVMTSPMYKDQNLFEHPEKFIPERFSKENRIDSHQYSFLPFGQGPRMCPGQQLAKIQVKTAVVNILRTFKLTTCKNTEIPIKEALRPSLTPANGVCLQLTRRQ